MRERLGVGGGDCLPKDAGSLVFCMTNESLLET